MQPRRALACGGALAGVGLLAFAGVKSGVASGEASVHSAPAQATRSTELEVVVEHEIPLVTFHGQNADTRPWSQKNDPVMGGSSSGTFTIDANQGVGVMDGEVKDVWFLQAPGFIKAGRDDHYPDITNCKAFAITAKVSNNYGGWRFSVGNAHAKECNKRHAYGYKANYHPSWEDFTTEVIPFEDFSDCWDDGTGEHIQDCSEENPQFCIDAATKIDLGKIEIWAEGAKGKVDIQIADIKAVGCEKAVGSPHHGHTSSSSEEVTMV